LAALQNLPHQLSADGQEMSTVLEGSGALLLQAQIRLVHQGGALQGVVRAFAPQIMMGSSAELVIHEWNRGSQGLVVARVPVRQ
jgi:hypothetical protein